MTDETKVLLIKAISDVGKWQWWDKAGCDFMIEFGSVLLFDETKKGRQPRSSVIALCFYENAFIVFLDNLDSWYKWYDELHEDMRDSMAFDPNGLVFDDKEYALNLLTRYKNRHGPFADRDDAVNTITNTKEILAGTCGDFGFIIGGDLCRIMSKRGEYTDDDVKRLFEMWWEYWKDYWNKKGTDEAYESDYACEVINPKKNPDSKNQGVEINMKE